MTRRPSKAAAHRVVAAVVVVAAGCGGGAAPTPPPTNSAAATVRFTERAAAAGVVFTHRSGAAGRLLLPEIMGGGAAWLDADGDGRLDAFLVDSGALAASGGAAAPPRHRLFRNRGDGGFDDVTERSFGGPFVGYGMGVATGDYDGDGDADLYVTGLGANRLWRNDGGRFADVTAEAGVVGGGWSTSAAFFDAEGDGDLDLFVCRYVDWRDGPGFTDRVCRGFGGARDYCSPQSYGAPATSLFFRNEGGGRFVDASVASGIAAKAGTALGVLCTDLDGDGKVDVYVANDQMPSFAWRSRGDGTFVEDGLRLGVAVDELGKSQAGMGVDAGDVDDDGDLDLWKVHLDRESHVLYRNRGGWFDDATTAAGLSAPTRPRTGFGTACADFDGDGRLDFFVADGRVEAADGALPGTDPYAEPDQLLLATDAGRFRDASEEAGLTATRRTSRGAAFGDYDDDGDVDVLVLCRDAEARLLRNDAPRRGSWLGLRVVDARGADLLGARVVVTTGGRRRVAEVRTAASYCSANDPRLRFFLPEGAVVDDVEVVLPSGARRRFGPQPLGRYVVLAP